MRRRTLLAAGSLALLGGCGVRPRRTPPLRRPTPSSSPSAAPPSQPAPAAAPLTGHAPSGTLRVAPYHHRFHRAGRALPTLVYAPVRAGRYPMVVFGHGLMGKPADYAALLTRWSAAGFVVAAPAFPDPNRSAAHFSLLDVPNQPADVGAVLSGLVTLPSTDPVARRLDRDHVAVAGHSAGAITALGVLTDDGPEGRDRRFTAGVILAGNLLGVGQTFSAPPVPVLFVHADHDPIVPYATGVAAYQQVPWPKALLTLPGDEHSKPYADPADHSYATVRAATTDFLRSSLYGDPAALRRFLATPHLQTSDLR